MNWRRVVDYAAEAALCGFVGFVVLRSPHLRQALLRALNEPVLPSERLGLAELPGAGELPTRRPQVVVLPPLLLPAPAEEGDGNHEGNCDNTAG